MRTLALLLALVVLPAAGASADKADAAYAAGRYLEAADFAEAAGGADNYARAARCILADEVASGTLDRASLERAERLARQALGEDKNHIEGRLQLAIALSMKSRLMSTREVLDAGYGKQGRDLALSVLEDEPGNAYAHGFLAVWNIEVLNKGGRLGAMWFGASLPAAREHYAAALDARPGDPSLCWQYARALAALDYRDHHEAIFENLRCAVEADTETAINTTMKARARAFWKYAAAGHTLGEIQARAGELL